MPTITAHICNHCNRKVKGQCPCRAKARREYFKSNRPTTNRRGYDNKWKRFRAWFLKMPGNQWCFDCQRTPPRGQSLEVHHVEKLKDNPGRRLDPANCMALCKSCHSIRTGRGE